MISSNQHHFFAIYKPVGYLSQFVNNQTKRKNKKLLSELFDFPKNVMAVGRLDEKSEGLLLITTDGNWSYFVNSSGFEKEYIVQLNGLINNEAISRLRFGVEISIPSKKSGSGIKSYLTKPCKVKKIEDILSFDLPFHKIRNVKHGPTSWISITLTEGKYRQIRKMTAAVGFPTLRLIRIRIGDFTLGHLKSKSVLKVNKNCLVNE